MDGDAVALCGAQHHQSHDRGAVDAVAGLFDLYGNGFGQAADEGDEFGAGARVKTALVGDFDGLRQIAQRPAPSISEATDIYFCPASRAAPTAGPRSLVLRALSSRINIGRLPPAINPVPPASSRLIARLGAVPPTRSARMMTPRPPPTVRIAPPRH